MNTDWSIMIKGWAMELGFVAIGFTDAEPIIALETVLQKRIEQGQSTSFEEKNIKLRIAPQAVWSDCQSVAVLAYPLPLTGPPGPGEGALARSATGPDYHTVVSEQLLRIMERLENNRWPGQRPRFQVDSGPLPERALALKAGIGWVGCNQQLIVPGYGSFVSLALLLLDQKLPVDQPVTGDCGKCQKCVQACPANLLGGDDFSASSCLSYLTQSKEVLNDEQIKMIGMRLFGCDSCQEVCPHNRERLGQELDIGLSAMDRMEPLSTYQRGLDLMKTLTMSQKEFAANYRHTAAGWRGKGILQRNALFGLINAEDARLLEWLQNRGNREQPLLQPYLERFKMNEH